MARSQGTVDSVAKKIQGAARTALLQTNELFRDRACTEKADSCDPDDDLPRQRATAPQFATRAVCQKLAKPVWYRHRLLDGASRHDCIPSRIDKQGNSPSERSQFPEGMAFWELKTGFWSSDG